MVTLLLIIYGNTQKQLDALNQDLQTIRHQNRLMENERTKFETNMIG